MVELRLSVAERISTKRWREASDDERAVLSQAPEYQDLRVELKRRLILAQGRRCCHCDQEQRSFNLRVWDLEHLLPQEKYPQFAFEPKNLAASCVDCNVAKGDYDPIVSRRTVMYPRSTRRFRMIHPHLDEWHEEIDRSGTLYQALSRKGSDTIYRCNLDRYVQEQMNWNSRPLNDDFETEITEMLEGRVSPALLLRVVLDARQRQERGAS